MRFKTTSPPRNPRCIAVARRRSVLALAAALLFTSLFIDVGVARAELPEGWVDPDLGEIASCVGVCGSLYLFKGKTTAGYALAGSCIDCVWGVFRDINDWMETTDPGNCFTGVLGQPCIGSREGSGY